MKNYLFILIIALLGATAHAQAVAWELSAQPGDQSSNVATSQGTNFNNCVLSRGAGVTATSGAGSINASGWFSGSTPTTLANAIANNDYYEFTINTINCLFFNPTSIKIVLRSSATGPSTATLRCNSDGFATDIGTVTVTTTSTVFTFSETLSPNSQSITYRLYGYGAAAGGGTPSAGGTMRIGSSVVAADNDLEVFATTTFVTVSSVSDITVADGDAVPATVFTANVPGATINWSRTPESIGLAPTSGTGDVPAFTADNNGSTPVTSTFTATATAQGCTSADETFTITVNPPACQITVTFLGTTGPCNDNGTPNDPSDDFFTRNVQAIFFNRPTTGNLQIVPGGDQIGVYSIPVNQIIGNSHIFNNVQFKADGTPTVIQMNFTDEPTCIDEATGPTVQSCSNQNPCTITVTFSGSTGPCNDNGTPNDPSDDFFTRNVQATFFNRPPTGNLQIVPGGDQIGVYSIPVNQIIGNSHIFNNVQFKADGTPTVIQMNFTDEPTCIDEATGPTVQPCSTPSASCEIIGFSFNNIDPCNDNTTPNDDSDDFFTVDVDVLLTNSVSNATLFLEGPDVVQMVGIPALIGTNITQTFTNVKLRADGQITNFEANIEGNANQVIHCALPGTGPSVGECSNGGSAPCAILDIDASNRGPCDDNGTSGDPTDDFFTLNVTVEFENPPATGTLDLTGQDLVPGGGNTSVAIGSLAGNSHTFTGVRYKADGQTTGIVARFSADMNCVASIGLAGEQPCSFPPPVLTCPTAATVSCAANVPTPNPASVSEAHSCPGAVSIIHLNDASSGQTCPNRITITRTYRGTDQCGQTGTCAQTITVNDQTNPTITCPPNVTVSCANNVPPASINAVTNVGDNCGGTVTVTNFPADAISNQTCPNRFTITRSYFAFDVCNNSANCIQTITVNDQTGPTISCPATQTVFCVEQVPAPDPALVTGSDNCGGAITPSHFSSTVSNQTCANRFTLTRQYRAADACGNTSSCTQIITVNDQTAPAFTFVPPNVTVDCYLVPGVGNPTASDNCTSGATVSFLGETETPGDCPPFKFLTRVWSATDACGNSTTAVQVVTVTDENAPQFLILPNNTIVECGPDNAAEFQAFLDNFGGAVVQDCAEIAYSHADSPIQNDYFDCGNTFHKNIRFFATDECGNVSFRDASFTAVDQTPPIFSTPPQSIDLECDASDDNGQNAFYDWLDANAGLVAEDACGAVFLEKILVTDKAGCGATWSKTYEFRATDDCGNVSKTAATFAVVDHTPPALVCPDQDFNLLSCIEDVPAADPAALSAWDCSPVAFTLKDTWTNGTGCPGWMMAVVYRYAATDDCGNEAVCEQVFQVEETGTPTLVCPDTIKLTCVADFPGPAQLFAYLKNLLGGDCAMAFTSITLLADSGDPQNGATHRSYAFTAKTHCGIVTSPCSVTFLATGNCNPLCTASQGSWGDPNATIGGMATADALDALLAEYGPVTVGGGGHTVSAADAACVQEMLFGSGPGIFLPAGHYGCPLPASLANPDGSLNNQIAANALALQLNIWYNRKFNDRDLAVQDIHNLPPCLVEFALLKDMGQNSTVQDLLDLTNLYLQGAVGYFPPEYPDYLNVALDNLNYFRVDCQPNAPCERPEAPVDSRNGKIGQQSTMRVFPNPTTGALMLEFWSEKDGAGLLKITDLHGVRLEQNIGLIPGWNTVRISLQDFPAGVYGLTLQQAAGSQALRVVKVGE